LREAPISWMRSRRLHNAQSRFVTWTVDITNFETLVRLSVASRKAALEPVRNAMKTSTRSGSRRYPGLHFVYSARKP
jgi:hypothetical protein